MGSAKSHAMTGISYPSLLASRSQALLPDLPYKHGRGEGPGYARLLSLTSLPRLSVARAGRVWVSEAIVLEGSVIDFNVFSILFSGTKKLMN